MPVKAPTLSWLLYEGVDALTVASGGPYAGGDLRRSPGGPWQEGSPGALGRRGLRGALVGGSSGGGLAGGAHLAYGSWCGNRTTLRLPNYKPGTIPIYVRTKVKVPTAPLFNSVPVAFLCGPLVQRLFVRSRHNFVLRLQRRTDPSPTVVRAINPFRTAVPLWRLSTCN